MELTRRGWGFWGCGWSWVALTLTSYAGVGARAGNCGTGCLPVPQALQPSLRWWNGVIPPWKCLMLLSVSCHGELAVPAHPAPNPARGQGWWRCLGCEFKLCQQGYQLGCILLQRGSVLGPVLVPSLPGGQQEPHRPPLCPAAADCAGLTGLSLPSIRSSSVHCRVSFLSHPLQ